MSFIVRGLPAAPFAGLSTLTPQELAARRIEIHVAEAKPGYPCRVALRDAEPGERLFLLNHTHHDVEGPYRSSHALFVLADARPASLGPGEVPEVLRGRLLSIRAFDDSGSMRGAEVADGREAGLAFRRMLADRRVAYLHVHSAGPGCYLARVERAPES
jgi:hypothetical protein